MRFPLVTEDFLLKAYPKRTKWSHKGDFGRVLVIGGSSRFKGAPALCGMAALRTGADIVQIACPETITDVVASFSPVLISEPLEGDFVNPQDLTKLTKLANDCDSVVIGPGLGRMRGTREVVLRFLSRLEKPCVIDADAIHFVSDRKVVLKESFVLTPHSYEFYSLSGHEMGKDIQSRVDMAKSFAKQFGSTVLFKGYKDIVSDGNRAAVNSTGNACMTVGGTGDVLSGICGALLAMGLKPFNAACCAAYISGKAGDIEASRLGPGMLPTDVIDAIPKALHPVWK